LTSVAALVLILAPVYALIVMQKAFYGPLRQSYPLVDASRREWVSLGLLVLMAVWLGLSPQAVLNVSAPAMKNSIAMERE
jgi:NADH-quinone oxidoreductase subunit M